MLQMVESQKTQKTASSSTHEESKQELLEKIRLVEERIQQLVDKGLALTHEVDKSSKAKLKAIELGFKTGHTAGFNLMKAYAKMVYPKGEWDEVNRELAEAAVGPWAN